MHYNVCHDAVQQLARLRRYCRHHDHLKALDAEYRFMRDEQTYARMTDPSFRTDPLAMDRVDSQTWLRTSLVINLSGLALSSLYNDIQDAYAMFSDLIHNYYPNCEVDIYFASAHITVKTIAGDISQSSADLERYAALIRPTVHRWVHAMRADTQLFAMGLFSSLSVERGLSLGLRFYPSLPLIQIIRGEVGAALYANASHLDLRPEASFHTMLTHSTNFRARLHDFPLQPNFMDDFRALIEPYDHHLFGLLTDLSPADFVIRHGYSDQLVPLAEVGCG